MPQFHLFPMFKGYRIEVLRPLSLASRWLYLGIVLRTRLGDDRCQLLKSWRTQAKINHHLFDDSSTVKNSFSGLYSSSITDLKFLSWYDESIGSLPDMLRYIKKLSQFTLATYVSSDTVAEIYDTKPDITPSGLLAALEPHRKHLDEIIIAASDSTEYKIDTSSRSMAHFTLLLRLAVADVFFGDLPGPDKSSIYINGLPPSITELQLQYFLDFTRRGEPDWKHDWPARCSALEHLAAVKREAFLYLRKNSSMVANARLPSTFCSGRDWLG